MQVPNPQAFFPGDNYRVFSIFKENLRINNFWTFYLTFIFQYFSLKVFLGFESSVIIALFLHSIILGRVVHFGSIYIKYYTLNGPNFVELKTVF